MNNPYASPAASYGSPAGEAYRTDDRAEVSELSLEMLRQTKPWVTFLSIMSFIGSAFMLLGGVSMIALGALAPSGRGASPFPAAALGAIYIPMALLYIYPALKLWGFSSAIGRLVASRSVSDLEAALGQQKSFWKFAGIVTIVMIALYGLFLVGMIFVGISAAGRH
jgi:Family of unknown function (DUF5362)